MSDYLEKKVEAYLTKRVKEKDGMSLKFISSVTGVPDRIVLMFKQTFFVEVKNATGKLSARQILMHDEMRRRKAKVCVIRSFDEVDAFIDLMEETYGD
jgi:hypothetical protein